MKIANKYRVPKRQWSKWPVAARKVFNDMYYTLKNNQYVMLHPKQDAISPRFWRTTAWNSAWLAAEFTRDAEREGMIG